MLSKKLRIKEDIEIIALNAPKDYKNILGELPKGVSIKTATKSKNDFIHLFVRNKKELEAQIFKVSATLNPNGLIWISYPKSTSGMQTDLTRDKGWECLEKLNMEWLSLISFDENWSAFLMRNTPPKKEISKASNDYQEHQALYIDAATKTVLVPEDVKTALKKNTKASETYNALAFSHRKEYVLWIVSAKREETRIARVKKMMEMLNAGKKNPSDK